MFMWSHGSFAASGNRTHSASCPACLRDCGLGYRATHSGAALKRSRFWNYLDANLSQQSSSFSHHITEKKSLSGKGGGYWSIRRAWNIVPRSPPITSRNRSNYICSRRRFVPLSVIFFCRPHERFSLRNYSNHLRTEHAALRESAASIHFSRALQIGLTLVTEFTCNRNRVLSC